MWPVRKEETMVQMQAISYLSVMRVVPLQLNVCM